MVNLATFRKLIHQGIKETEQLCFRMRGQLPKRWSSDALLYLPGVKWQYVVIINHFQGLYIIEWAFTIHMKRECTQLSSALACGGR